MSTTSKMIISRRGIAIFLVAMSAVAMQLVARAHQWKGQIRPNKGWYEYGAMRAKGSDLFGFPDGSLAPAPPGYTPTHYASGPAIR
jgi:hypothetical protein